MPDNTDERLAAQAEMVSRVAHDLRTPLSALLGMVQTMQRKTLDADVTQQFLRRMEISCFKMESLIADVSALAQLDAGRLPLHREEIDVTALLAEVRRSAAGDIVVDADHVPPFVSDHARVAQVLGRLVDNALRYSSAPPVLSVRTEPQAVVFEVADDGEGPSPEHADRIWERFFQVPGDRKRGRSGLGLAVASELSAWLGGDVQLECQPGRCVFSLRLPVA